MSKKSWRERDFERLCKLFNKTPPKKFDQALYTKLVFKENQVLKEENLNLKRKLELKEKQNERKAKRLKSYEDKVIELIKKCGEGFKMIEQEIAKNNTFQKAMIDLTKEKMKLEENLKSLENTLRKEYEKLESHRRERLREILNEKYFEWIKDLKDEQVTEKLRNDLNHLQTVCSFIYKK